MYSSTYTLTIGYIISTFKTLYDHWMKNRSVNKALKLLLYFRNELIKGKDFT